MKKKIRRTIQSHEQAINYGQSGYIQEQKQQSFVTEAAQSKFDYNNQKIFMRKNNQVLYRIQ